MPATYSTVDNVISALCRKQGDFIQKNYGQYLDHAYSWLNSYASEEARQLKTVWLALGPDRVAELPPDYVDWVVVGKPVGEQVRNLGYNARLNLLTPPVEPWTDKPALDAPVDTCWPSFDYCGYSGGVLRGYGYGEYWEEFVVDEAERVLRVSSAVDPDQPLVFQYVSNAVEPNQATPIHEYAQEELEQYILWKHWFLQGDNRWPYAKDEYFRVRRLSKKKRDPFTLTDLEGLLQEAYNQGPN